MRCVGSTSALRKRIRPACAQRATTHRSSRCKRAWIATCVGYSASFKAPIALLRLGSRSRRSPAAMLNGDPMLKRFLVLTALVASFAGQAFAAVDVNSADEDALRGIKGIGPAKARAILDERA